VSTTLGDAQAVKDATTPATAIHLKVFVIGSLISLIDRNFLTKINWFRNNHPLQPKIGSILRLCTTQMKTQ
jgi:hypothetical protein